MERTRRVFIFGAGASVHAGAPTMRTFFDAAEDLLLSPLAGTARDSIANALGTLHRLRGLYATANLDLTNIETVMGITDMAGSLDMLNDMGSSEISRFRDDLLVLIITTLEQSVRFPVGKTLQPPSHTAAFIESCIKAHDGENVAIITFNYDYVLDASLAMKGIGIDYCLGGQEKQYPTKLLKLHGSVGWTKSRSTGRIYAVDPVDILTGYNRYLRLTGREVDSVQISVGEHLQQMADSKSDLQLSGLPVIIPPTWNKSHYWSDEILYVWRAAARALSEAQEVYVVGYSLPESDTFFSYLFALGTFSQNRIRRFVVVDPNPAVDSRFRALLGPEIEKTYDFQPLCFDGAVRHFSNCINRQA